MQLSKLKNKIDIIENISESELEEDDWQLVLTCYSEIIAMNYSSLNIFDDMKSGHLSDIDQYIFKIRYSEKIKKNMRIKLDNDYFVINKITKIYNKNNMLSLLANKIN